MTTSMNQTAIVERLSRALPAPALVIGEDVKQRSSNVWGTRTAAEIEFMRNTQAPTESAQYPQSGSSP